MNTISGIIARVSCEFEVSPVEIASRRHNAGTVLARHTAFWLARQKRFSYPALADAFDRDHTTIIHGVKRIEARMRDDEAFKARVERIA